MWLEDLWLQHLRLLGEWLRVRIRLLGHHGHHRLATTTAASWLAAATTSSSTPAAATAPIRCEVEELAGDSAAAVMLH